VNDKESEIAACGIDCAACDIRRAPGDAAIRQRILDWLRDLRHVEAKPEEIRCSGCRGDRATHWSPDCWILRCCVDERHLADCSDCTKFACEQLVAWAAKSEGYGRALNRLRERVKAR